MEGNNGGECQHPMAVVEDLCLEVEDILLALEVIVPQSFLRSLGLIPSGT